MISFNVQGIHRASYFGGRSLGKKEELEFVWLSSHQFDRFSRGNSATVRVQIDELFFKITKCESLGDNEISLTPPFYERMTLKFAICKGLPEFGFALVATRVEQAVRSTVVSGSKASHQALTFPQFLKKAHIVGIPDHLEETLNPVLCAFGPLKEKMKGRGLKAEKGILLYGPPGTGKTRLACAITDFVLSPEVAVKKICATDLLNSHIGKTERNIRDIFKLDPGFTKLVLVIDEIDAITRSRSKCRESWEITQVTEFLSCMDGVFEREDILVIATTNNLGQIDEALLRPGRFGVKIKFNLPEVPERKKIFKMYLKHLRDKNLIASDVNTSHLATLTKGYTGADIKGIVSRVNEVAFHRVKAKYDQGTITLDEVDTDLDAQVRLQDFKDVIANQTEEDSDVLPNAKRSKTI